MVLVMRAGFTLACDAQNGVGAGVEQVDGRVHGPVEQVQRHRCPQRQQLGLADGPGFRGQFTHHDVQVRNDEEGGKERHAFDHFRRVDADGAQDGLENVGKRRLTDPAQSQRREGDAQLAGREVSVELTVHGAQDVPAPAVLFSDGFDPGRA
ncbi:hypothetical protein D3C84_638270 [compost metagenome]